jgi:apolipoprotein N-acyltransferase
VRPRDFRRPLASIGAGVLMALAQPGFELWPIAWIALVPLFAALHGQSARRALALGWLAGWAYYAVILYWIAPTIATYTRIVMPAAIFLELLLAVVAGALVGGFAAGLQWFAAAGISRVMVAPILWIVVEWVRTFFPAAFPWGFVGYSQYRVGPVLQIVDVAGIYGLSAFIVFVNVSLAELWRDGPARHRKLVLANALVIAAVLAYGGARSSTLTASEGPELRVGLVQGNIAQEMKWRPGLDEEILARYLALSATAAARGAKLIVWPEAAVPFFLGVDRRTREIEDFARRTSTAILTGAPGYEQRNDDEPRQYNQAWLVDEAGERQGPYDKIRLVPFGEYVPWGGIFGLVQKAVEGIGDFGAGSTYTVFSAPAAGVDGAPTPVSALICYEAIFPGLTRKFAAAGAGLLVNVSNDAWYGRTAAPTQLLAMIAVRAVENRIPLVRSTNTGISAVVSPVGAIRAATGLFEEAVVVEDVKLVQGFSLYAALGDWFVYVSLVLLVALAVVRIRSGVLLIPANRHGILPQ